MISTNLIAFITSSLYLATNIVATPVPGGNNPSAPVCPFERTPPLEGVPVTPNIGGPETLSIISSFNNDENIIGTWRTMFTTTDPKGQKYTEVTASNLRGGNIWGVYKTSKGTYIGAGPSFLWRSTNGGKTFNQFAIPSPDGYPVSGYGYHQFSESNGQILWGTQNGFYISLDDGQTWSELDCSKLLDLHSGIDRPEDCKFLFVASQTLTPTSDKLIATFKTLGHPGVYALDLPVPVVNGTLKPTWSAVLKVPLCVPPPGSPEICASTGPITFFKNDLYVGSQGTLVKVAYPTASAPEVVLQVNAFEPYGVVASKDQSTLVVSFDNGVYYSKTPLVSSSWKQVGYDGCSEFNLINRYPTKPYPGFSRGLAPLVASNDATFHKFLIGNLHGPYVLNIPK
jgi:hypothetical protein